MRVASLAALLTLLAAVSAHAAFDSATGAITNPGETLT